MKDKEMKVEDVKTSDTLGWVSYSGLWCLYIDSTEEVVSFFEVELQKQMNLSTHESEECDHGEGVEYEYASLHIQLEFVYCCLLLIDKTKAKEKTYMWFSVWWKTKS